jgi:hypothetical protein
LLYPIASTQIPKFHRHDAMEDMFFIQTENEIFREDWLSAMPVKFWMPNTN